jgi:hypothetical protein
MSGKLRSMVHSLSPGLPKASKGRRLRLLWAGPLLLTLACGETNSNADLPAETTSGTGGRTKAASGTGGSAHPEATASGTTGAEASSAAFAGELNPGAMFRGHYSTSFEHSGFKDCEDPSEPWGWWWSQGSRAAGSELFEELGPNPDDPPGIYVQLDGVLSEPGEWGHLGQYERELTATHIYYVAHAKAADCD